MRDKTRINRIVNSSIKKFILPFLVISLLIIASCGGSSSTIGESVDATIYKSSSCGCCGIYAKYFKGQGFDTKIVDLPNIDSIKQKYKIPYNLQSCHTTEIEGYFVEGHIPVDAVNKLLEERPDIKGIAMPGMPSGSPGMPGRKVGDFVIYAVNHDESTYEFMRL